MRQHSTGYVIAFATAVCVVCSVLVSGAAVILKPRQEANELLARRMEILAVAGLSSPGEKLSREEVEARFTAAIRPRVVNLASGAYVDGVDPSAFDPEAVLKDPILSRPAPPNAAKVRRLPIQGLVYEVVPTEAVEMTLIPIEGMGLWSTLYGYLAMDADGVTVRGITFYSHAETPGLGGEVDNPRWKASWPGRKAFDTAGNPVIRVLKGKAGPPETDPHSVDGISGATLTTRGVSNLVAFWLGPDGYGSYLQRLREAGGAP